MKWWLPAPLLAGVTLAAHGPAPNTFQIAPDVRSALHRLYDESAAAKAERVACLASTVDGDTLRITAISPLDGPLSDSLAVSAAASLASCAPPAWQGTVHTHIALRDGQRPYSSFSGADRGVMLMWGQRWRMAGTFCLVYSSEKVHCEIDGPEGGLIFPSASY
jgi:hypothetical protein